jgi:hypothetical protein
MKIIKMIFFVFLILISTKSSFGQRSPNVSIFGLTIGKPLNIPECKKYIAKYGKDRWYSYLRIRDSIVCDCFEVRNPDLRAVKKKEILPASLVHPDDTLYFIFAKGVWPSYLLGFPEITIANNNLIKIELTTDYHKADIVLKQLEDKYGKNYSRKNFISNGDFDTREFFIAKWEFSDITVEYKSMMTNLIDRGTVTISQIDHNRYKNNGRDM